MLIKPDETRGSFEDGEIAAMVEPAQGANIKKAAQDGAAVPDAFRSSVKVVAGERNQLFLGSSTQRNLPLAA